MKNTTIRTKLTDAEYNAVIKLTSATKLDGSFDLWYDDTADYWIDLEDDDKLVDLTTGFNWLAEALAYPLAHEGLDPEESLLVVNLLKEFANISDNEVESLLHIDEEDN